MPINAAKEYFSLLSQDEKHPFARSAGQSSLRREEQILGVLCGGDEAAHEDMVFATRCGLDTAGRIDGKGPHVSNGLGDVIRFGP